VVVANGQFAVDAFQQVAFDAIFLDFHMPVMDGLEATRIIRGSEKGRDIPIWALTADATPEAQHQCREAGMNGVITKPFQLSDLKEALGEAGGEEEQKAMA
jgi:CheY-like chemotaxis protein